MSRVDSKGRAVAAPACISLSHHGAMLSLSSLENVDGHDITVQLKSECCFLFVCFSIDFSGCCISLLQTSLKCLEKWSKYCQMQVTFW